MPKYTVKDGCTINVKTGSLKNNDQKIISYKGGDIVEMSEEDALTHVDVLVVFRDHKGNRTPVIAKEIIKK